MTTIAGNRGGDSARDGVRGQIRPLELLRAAGLRISRVPLFELDGDSGEKLSTDDCAQKVGEQVRRLFANADRGTVMDIICESFPPVFGIPSTISIADFGSCLNPESLPPPHMILGMFTAFERIGWTLFPQCDKQVSDILTRGLRAAGASRLADLAAEQLAALLREVVTGVRLTAFGAFCGTPVEQAEAYIRSLLNRWLDEQSGMMHAGSWLRVSARRASAVGCRKGIAVIDPRRTPPVLTVSLSTRENDTPGSRDLLRELGVALAAVPWRNTGISVVQVEFSTNDDGVVIDSADYVEESWENFLAAVHSFTDSEVAARLIGSFPAELALVVAHADQLVVVAGQRKIGSGISGGVGLIAGRLCVSAEALRSARIEGESTILCADFPDASLMPQVVEADGFVFAHGGVTSHFAVVARGMGKPCILGVRPDLVIAGSEVSIGDTMLSAGEWITLDGSEGTIYRGRVTVEPKQSDRAVLSAFLLRCDALSGVAVMANADDAAEVAEAVAAGAQGVGLCRTEHLLLRRPLRQVFADALVELLLCREVTNEIATLEVSRALWAHTDFVQQIAARLTRAKCDPRYSSFLRRLENLERALSDHFVGIIRMAQNRRVTIRLLDPPFAEFIREADLAEMVADGRIMEEDRAKIGRVFRQSHPMLSLRGARFAIAYPELCRMQVRAVMSAAVRVARETVQRQKIDFMLPFVVDAAEVAVWKDVIMAGLLGCEPNQVETALGVMIETPRSVLMAADIASKVDFLAFGTNDLSQLTWGYSRDDDGDFMSSSAYAWSAGRPFNSFDVEGVGQLIKLAVSSIRQQAARVRIGVCGEHAAMPEAIGFFVSCGVDYLSCVPRLVPEVRAFVGRAAASSFIRR